MQKINYLVAMDREAQFYFNDVSHTRIPLFFFFLTTKKLDSKLSSTGGFV